MLAIRHYLPVVFSLVVLTATIDARAAEGRVEMELVTIGDFPFEQTRDWAEMLQKLNVGNVRIHSGSDDDKPEIVTGGSEKSPLYKVKGLLTPGGNLILPGGKFKLSDKAALGRW